MSAFAVISTIPQNPDLEKKVRDVYPGDHLRISPSIAVWLVADTGITSQGVCTKLGIASGGIDTALVVKVDSYWGFASKNIWEWLSVKGSGP